MHRAVVAYTVGVAVTLFLPAALTAQGFQVNEHGTCAMGRGGTGVALPCRDGSSMWLNPAGIAGAAGFRATLGATFIDAQGGFFDDTTGQRTGLANDIIPVPHVYLTYGDGSRYGLGVGVFVPYGLGTEWPLTFEGRFSGYDNELRSIYVQPTAAITLFDRLSLGAGLDIAIGSVELNQRVDFHEQAAPPPAPPGTFVGQLGIPRGTEIADIRIKATGATGVGGHFGALLRAHEKLSIGARYMTRVTLDYDGTADFTQITTGIILPPFNPFAPTSPTPLPVDALVSTLMASGGPLADQGGSTSITMPDQFVAGFALTPIPQFSFLFDYQWTHWTLFDSVQLNFENGAVQTLPENYQNTSAVRFGVEWTPGTAGTFRAGYLYHEGASPDETVTPLLPESARNEFTVGYGVQITSALSADLAYQYIRQNDRRGRVRGALPGEPTTTALNMGLYKFTADLFGVTLSWGF